jgi:hypothetical protein
MQVLSGHTLIALDGTEFHCSDNPMPELFPPPTRA